MMQAIRKWLHPAPFSGAVIDKHSYGAAGIRNTPSAVSEGKHGPGDFAEGETGLMDIQDTASFYLVVENAQGKRKDIFVDEMSFNNTAIGDQWPNTLKT